MTEVTVEVSFYEREKLGASRVLLVFYSFICSSIWKTVLSFAHFIKNKWDLNLWVAHFYVYKYVLYAIININ